jgi:hypothetical protein
MKSSRRDFIRQLGVLSSGIFIPTTIFSKSTTGYAKFKSNLKYISVRGFVQCEGKPVKNVIVSDGLSVFKTDEYGEFNFLTNSNQDFVFITTPPGFKVNTDKNSIASFYFRIDQAKEKLELKFELEKVEESDTNHSFLLLADPQIMDDADTRLFYDQTIPDVKNTILSLKDKNLFGVSCGDIVYDRMELFPDYITGVEKTGIPFFQVLGNHDCVTSALSDKLSATAFQKHFGPRYYSFDRGEIHYVVLDNVFWFKGYIGYIDDIQLEWLQNDLAFVEKGKTVVVFSHVPVFTRSNIRNKINELPRTVSTVNRALLYELLSPYKSYLIAGHMHELELLNDSGCEIHICGAVCGAWWTAPISHDGSPNGYMIYNISGSQLRWTYKSTNFPLSHQIKIHKLENKLLANIWAFQDSWTVSYYVNGEKIGSPSRVLEKDPDAIKYFEGSEIPEKHKWIEPVFTDHMFEVNLNNLRKNDKITIEAANQFGDIFTESIVI